MLCRDGCIQTCEVLKTSQVLRLLLFRLEFDAKLLADLMLRIVHEIQALNTSDSMFRFLKSRLSRRLIES